MLAATLVAAITFAVMIGSFYLAEQYLNAQPGYSPLGASTVLVAGRVAGRGRGASCRPLVDRRGERLPAILGFLAAGLGLGTLAIPAVSLRSPASIVLLVPFGLGLGHAIRRDVARRAERHARRLPRADVRLLSLGRLVGAAAGPASLEPRSRAA